MLVQATPSLPHAQPVMGMPPTPPQATINTQSMIHFDVINIDQDDTLTRAMIARKADLGIIEHPVSTGDFHTREAKVAFENLDRECRERIGASSTVSWLDLEKGKRIDMVSSWLEEGDIVDHIMVREAYSATTPSEVEHVIDDVTQNNQVVYLAEDHKDYAFLAGANQFFSHNPSAQRFYEGASSAATRLENRGNNLFRGYQWYSYYLNVMTEMGITKPEHSRDKVDYVNYFLDIDLFLAELSLKERKIAMRFISVRLNHFQISFEDVIEGHFQARKDKMDFKKKHPHIDLRSELTKYQAGNDVSDLVLRFIQKTLDKAPDPNTLKTILGVLMEVIVYSGHLSPEIQRIGEIVIQDRARHTREHYYLYNNALSMAMDDCSWQRPALAHFKQLRGDDDAPSTVVVQSGKTHTNGIRRNIQRAVKEFEKLTKQYSSNHSPAYARRKALNVTIHRLNNKITATHPSRRYGLPSEAELEAIRNEQFRQFIEVEKGGIDLTGLTGKVFGKGPFEPHSIVDDIEWEDEEETL